MSAYGNAAVAQSVERRLGKAEVTGSIPVSSFIFLQNESCIYSLQIWELVPTFLHFHGCTMLGDRYTVTEVNALIYTNRKQ